MLPERAHFRISTTRGTYAETDVSIALSVKTAYNRVERQVAIDVDPADDAVAKLRFEKLRDFTFTVS